ncbi:hypothetical protein [Paenibacillus sp. R14(2021)]|uniref:hypothetical protein n=1 Tax=Paenibacillus sp. R14(2021) TaxID=2859228 RepID=UPI001C616ADF|nr:hypothetical protein [Paenibacillus sp. R14(2021)]
MQDLIKLLFSNIYVVIVIIGFLLTLFNRARGRQNQNNRMPPFGGGTTSRPAGERQQQAERPVSRPAAVPSPQRAAQRRVEPQSALQPVQTTSGSSLYTTQLKPSGEGVSLEFAGRDTLAQALEADRQAQAKARTAPAGTTGEAPRRTQDGTFRVPQGDELRQAFVMAEVLGAPRSKRPLRRP